jgi:hypothetical protein
VLLILLLPLTRPDFLCAVESNESSQQAAEDKEGCNRNPTTIHAAIQAYQKDKKDLPNWFSDLVPQYLPDVTVLICPVSRRTGKTEPPGLADPKVASSYLFEFCPLPLGNELPSAPNRTRREWKLKQVELVGLGVPVVRCRQHTPLLNIGLDGRLYESPLAWEELFTNKASVAFLTPTGILGGDKPAAAATVKSPALRIPARDPQTPKYLLDLTAAYNALLTETWHGGEINNNNLAAIDPGIQNFGGVEFDVRGVLQLAGRSLSSERFPPLVSGIKVKQKCKKLHFLHATGWGKPEEDGKQVGSYLPPLPGVTATATKPFAFRNWWTTAKSWPRGLLVGAAAFFSSLVPLPMRRTARRKRRLRARLASSGTLLANNTTLAGSSGTFVISSSFSGSAQDEPRRVAGQPLILIDSPGKTETRTTAFKALHKDLLEDRSLREQLTLWLKQKLVRRLISDRAELLNSQQQTTLRVMAVDERLSRIETHLQQQNRIYELRIEELNRELLASRQVNAALIHAKIAQVKAEMEAAKARVMAQARDLS